MDLKVRVEANPSQNEMWIRFVGLPTGSTTYSLGIAETINLEVDEEGRVVGIEFRDLEKALGVKPRSVTGYGPIVGVKEAAALAGVNRPNFLRDYAKKPDFPGPLADLAGGRIWLLSDVVAHIKGRGLRKKETLAYSLMVYLEANEMTVGALSKELGISYQSTLNLLRDQTKLDEAKPLTLSRRHGIAVQAAQSLLTRLRAIRALTRSAEMSGKSPENGL